MKFCGKCGSPMDDGVRFCPSCGAPVAEPVVEQPVAEPTAQQAEGNATGTIQQKFDQFNNTADTTTEFDPNDIATNKAMGILAYLSWLVLIPLFAAKESKFARFHTNQGLVLAIVEIGYAIVVSILNAILTVISWRLGLIMSTVFSLLALVFLVFSIIGIINAANGKAKELPIIGKFRLLK